MTARLPRQVLMMAGYSHHTDTTAGRGPQIVVVTLPIEIDIANDGHVHDALTQALRDGATVLVADATCTTFCDCAGVSVLVRVHHQAAAAGAHLRIAASPAVRRILELTGVNLLVDTYLTVGAALDRGQDPAERARARLPAKVGSRANTCHDHVRLLDLGYAVEG